MADAIRRHGNPQLALHPARLSSWISSETAMPAPTPAKLDLASMDIPGEKLRQMFPEVFTAIGGERLAISFRKRETVQEPSRACVTKRHPMQFICLDRALQSNDTLKVNSLETFRAAQPEILFRTI